jgi:hypothetical protein
MNPWTQVLTQIWYLLENGPKSGPLTTEFPVANRCRYGTGQNEPPIPINSRQPVLIVDQTGGQIDLDYSPVYIRVTEEFQITVWTESMDLAKLNELRLKVLAAIDTGLPDLGLPTVLDVKLRSGMVTSFPDKVERHAEGRPMARSADVQKFRKRAVLLELTVVFLIDRATM